MDPLMRTGRPRDRADRHVQVEARGYRVSLEGVGSVDTFDERFGRLRDAAEVASRCGIENEGPESMSGVFSDTHTDPSYSGRHVIVYKVVDVFDFDGSFIPNFTDIVGKNTVVLIVNKMDLLPENVSKTRIKDWVRREAKRRGETPTPEPYSPRTSTFYPLVSCFFLLRKRVRPRRRTAEGGGGPFGQQQIEANDLYAAEGPGEHRTGPADLHHGYE